MREIYTDVAGLSLDGVVVHHVSQLVRRDREWVMGTKRRLMSESTLPEDTAGKMMSMMDEKPIRQAFFRIRKRSYFTDFFFPSMLLAVEIDGSSHRTRKDKDRRRDADFRSVGIRTIRVSNKVVMTGHLFERLFTRLYRVP